MLWINSSFSADQKRKADGEREKSVDRCGLNWDVVVGDSDTGAGSGLGYLGGTLRPTVSTRGLPRAWGLPVHLQRLFPPVLLPPTCV